MSKTPPRLKEKSKFVPTCHRCHVVGHIRPSCPKLRSLSTSKVRSPSRKPSNSKPTHVCHHCGAFGHTLPNCFKLFPHKWVSNRSHPLSKCILPILSELLKVWAFQLNFNGILIPLYPLVGILGHELVKRENSWPITSWHVILPSLQNTANYKVPRIAVGFVITTQKPTEICQVSCKNQSHISTYKRWHKQSSTCKWWHKQTNQAMTYVTNQTPPRVAYPPPNSYK